MERKSVGKSFIRAAICLLTVVMAASAAGAQWWSSTSSTSSSSTSTSGWWTSTSSTSSSSTSSSSGALVYDPGKAGLYRKCTYTPPADEGYSEAKVYYPCTSTGTRSATTLTSGYGFSYNTMEWLADHLVSHGFIVFAMTPAANSETNEPWTAAHLAGIAQLKKENTRRATILNPNPIKGKIKTTALQVMGYERGGGGAIKAAIALGAGVKTVQALMPTFEEGDNLSGMNVNTALAIHTNNCYGPNAYNFNGLDFDGLEDTIPMCLDFTRYFYLTFQKCGWLTGTDVPKTEITAFMKYFLGGDAAYESYMIPIERGTVCGKRTNCVGSSFQTSCCVASDVPWFCPENCSVIINQ